MAEDGLSNLDGVGNIAMILSGKGGVGKSTVTVQLALALVHSGKKVGILDIDICGPSIPKMLGLEGKSIQQCSAGWVPVYADAEQRLGVISLAFLLKNRNDAVVWRGPKKNSMIKQFLEDVAWGELDYLLIDTPPGTSDEHMTAAESLLGRASAVIVTTPQDVALSDVRKEISFCEKINLPILGLVENMSGFVCPHCEECTPIFGSGGGEALAAARGVRFLGRIPIDPKVAEAAEEGTCSSFIASFPSSRTSEALGAIVSAVLGNEPAAMDS